MENMDWYYRFQIWYDGGEKMYAEDNLEKRVFLVYEKDMLVFNKTFEAAITLLRCIEKDVDAYENTNGKILIGVMRTCKI